MTLPVKLLAATTITAGTVLGGISIHKFTEPENIREALLKRGRTILNTRAGENANSEEKEKWNKIVSKEDLRSGLKKFLNIEEETVSDWDSKIEILKTTCSKKLSIKKDEPNFLEILKDAEKYCVQTD